MNLSNLGVQELNAKEACNIDGGNPFSFLTWLISAGVAVHEMTCDDEKKNHFLLLSLSY